MNEPPLLPGRLYGLRTWRVLAGPDGPLLAAPYRGTPWPVHGAALEATCPDASHVAPAASCTCGLHAWHPRRRSARRVLAGRFEVPGIVEAWGAVELHEDGFRAQRARPHALLLAKGRYEPPLRALGERYGVPVVSVRRPDDVLAYCERNGLGLAPDVVDDLLGPEELARTRRAREARRRRSAVRMAAALTLTAAVAGAGSWFAAHEPKGPRTIVGRGGPVHLPAHPSQP